MELMGAGEKQLQSEDPHFKIGGCWRGTERERGLFRESKRREQKPRRTNGRRKAMEPICSTPFSSLCLSLSFFPCYSTQRRNLCYLLVTFIWSPRVLDLSLGLLSHTPSTLTTPPPPAPSPIFYVFPLAIAYQQPAASNSPELLIPDFRPVGKTLAPFLLVLLRTSLSLAAASPSGPTTWPLLSEVA